ncbi:MAG: hypothetical protein IPK79_07430 [Vampirovibrionales bacterium]|nr:hypothetical protein [Vampirovibrionales bacterium]
MALGVGAFIKGLATSSIGKTAISAGVDYLASKANKSKGESASASEPVVAKQLSKVNGSDSSAIAESSSQTAGQPTTFETMVQAFKEAFRQVAAESSNATIPGNGQGMNYIG